MMTDKDFVSLLDALRDIERGQPAVDDSVDRLVEAAGDDPERRALLEEALAFRAAFASARRAAQAEDSTQTDPLADFASRTGISPAQLAAALPEGQPESLPGRDRGAVHEPRRHAPAVGKRPMANVGRAAMLALPVLLGALLLTVVLSALTTPNAVKWASNEVRLKDGAIAAPEVRARSGTAPEEPGSASEPAADLATGSPLSEVDLGWRTLHSARKSTAGLFPRFSDADVARAARHFELAAQYARAPTEVRGEALYGLAVATWLGGEPYVAMTLLNDGAIPYSAADDSAKRLREAIQRDLAY